MSVSIHKYVTPIKHTKTSDGKYAWYRLSAPHVDSNGASHTDVIVSTAQDSLAAYPFMVPGFSNLGMCTVTPLGNEESPMSSVLGYKIRSGSDRSAIFDTPEQAKIACLMGDFEFDSRMGINLYKINNPDSDYSPHFVETRVLFSRQGRTHTVFLFLLDSDMHRMDACVSPGVTSVRHALWRIGYHVMTPSEIRKYNVIP